MSTYNGWTIITMPTSPPAKSIEWSANDIVAVSTNPFTGQQQVQDWNARYMEASLTMPPMSATDAANWVAFFLAAKGQVCVFQLPAGAFALLPSGTVPGTYWRMKANVRKWSVSEGMIHGFQFDIREAI